MQAGEENDKEGEDDCETPLPTMANKVPRRDLFPSHEPTTQKNLVHKPQVPRDDELNDFEDDHERTGKDEERHDPNYGHELQRSTRQMPRKNYKHDEFKNDPELRRKKEDETYESTK